MDHITEPARRTPVLTSCDVLVVGGGSAGVAAAVAAARRGADVVLAEKGTYLGGLATGGLIILLLTLDDGAGQQVVGGLCQEVTERLTARGAALSPPAGQWGSTDRDLIERYQRAGLVWGRAPHVVRYSVAYDPEELKYVLEEMCAEAGVRLLYDVVAADAITNADSRSIDAVTFQGKEGRFAVQAQTVIDTTGDGDLFTAAGCAHAGEAVAPWLWFTVGGVDPAAAEAGAGRGWFTTTAPGRVLFTWNAAGGLRHVDPTSSADRAFAATSSRKLVMEHLDRLRATQAGFEQAYLCHIADQLDITESRRLQGRYVLGRDDVDRRFDDVIACTGNWTKYGCLYHIPYRSLLPAEFDNLATAGRHISVDHRTHHSTKEIPACIATGQAAGTAAALALGSSRSLPTVDLARLQSALEADGAILRPDDPAPVDPRHLSADRHETT